VDGLACRLLPLDLEGAVVHDDLLVLADGGFVIETHAQLIEHFAAGEGGSPHGGFLRVFWGVGESLLSSGLLGLHGKLNIGNFITIMFVAAVLSTASL
jgi:hypothetical protein